MFTLSYTVIEEALEKITKVLCQQPQRWLLVYTEQQRIYHFDGLNVVQSYPVSTSKYGLGNKDGSYQTPPGVHAIAEKHGAQEPLNTIFVARQSIGEKAFINSADKESKDVITSRILWLKGKEEGVNMGGNIDSYQRYIYIHGTADEANIGHPASIGCVRMLNADVVDLFDQVVVDTPILIL